MKYLICFLLSFSPLLARTATPLRDPVFPWPLGVQIQNIDQEILTGHYVAFSHDAFWFIEVSPANDDGLRKITLESSSLYNNRGFGWLSCDGKVLMGELFVGVRRSFTVMLYQVPEGLNLRIANSASSYFDLLLKKNKD